MPSTSVYALPYLAPTDPPDIAGLGEGLAEATEDELARIDADIAAMTPAKATVATSQTTTSTSYVDLATVGPAVAIAHGSVVVVHLSALMFSNSPGGQSVLMSFAVSGANTIAAIDDNALQLWDTSSAVVKHGITITLTGLNPGTSTFTAKYKVGAGTGTFQHRNLTVVPY